LSKKKHYEIFTFLTEKKTSSGPLSAEASTTNDQNQNAVLVIFLSIILHKSNKRKKTFKLIMRQHKYSINTCAHLNFFILV